MVLIRNPITAVKTATFNESLRLQNTKAGSVAVLHPGRSDGTFRLSVSTSGCKTYMLEYKNGAINLIPLDAAASVRGGTETTMGRGEGNKVHRPIQEFPLRERLEAAELYDRRWDSESFDGPVRQGLAALLSRADGVKGKAETAQEFQSFFARKGVRG